MIRIRTVRLYQVVNDRGDILHETLDYLEANKIEREFREKQIRETCKHEHTRPVAKDDQRQLCIVCFTILEDKGDSNG